MRISSVVVTGACGLLGRAITEALLDLGYRVLGVDINHESLNALQQDLSTELFQSTTCDLSNEEGISSLFKVISEIDCTFGAFIHAAYPRSEGWGTKFERLNSECLMKDIQMQLGCAILFSREVIRYFRSNGGGTLVHLSSIQGVSAPKFDHYTGTSMTSPIEYCAIKSGIIAFSRWLAKYCSSENIRVNVVSPGGIADSQPQSFVERYRASCSNVGMLCAADVASAVVFLLSDGAYAINGHNLIVDDGWSL